MLFWRKREWNSRILNPNPNNTHRTLYTLLELLPNNKVNNNQKYLSISQLYKRLSLFSHLINHLYFILRILYESLSPMKRLNSQKPTLSRLYSLLKLRCISSSWSFHTNSWFTRHHGHRLCLNPSISNPNNRCSNPSGSIRSIRSIRSSISFSSNSSSMYSLLVRSCRLTHRSP